MSGYPNPVPFTNSGASMLPPLTSLRPNQYIQSPNRRYRAVLQDDGNFVLYDYPAGKALWVGDSSSPYGSVVTLGPYGIAEVFTDRVLYVNNRPKSFQWYSTITAGTLYEGQDKRVHLSVQDDGNLVLLDIIALWAYNTNIPLTPSVGDANVIGPGVDLERGKRYNAGNYFLIFQDDGNLVVYRNDGFVMWHTATGSKGAARATMQTDGNFVIFDANGSALWNSGTYNNPGAFAQIQSNGNFVICKGVTLWARFGFTPQLPRPPRVVFYPDHTDPLENGTNPFPTYGHIGYEF
ncbi:putidacin L1 family lectin-like bacteriocin [Pseudomonas sp. RC10]|uniref:putidacin L1 family lectin-like bacteriocin n=1 Tax=Pseudomonas bambusae TaxID=3139142 RepID=UPI003139993F